ncbi:unnamed protein product [Lactuca saligna]|uniref:Ubiquitin-like protease family profile domain-containing protein n=1 Tax=Lactuca saligna TaxID=75948 RepID=A0AA35VIM0_LACSI|nr:unnamed protein product [Lactuca saligna]
MDNWEKDKQFGVNDMENVDAGETFFRGLDPESGHTYMQTPLPVVVVKDNTVTPLKGRVKMKSKFCREPYTQNRKGKKAQKSNNVEKRPLRLDDYADIDDEFWKLWGKNMWTIINHEGTTLEPGKQHYLRRVAVGMVDGPHWKDIDRVLIPINIPHLHWYLADLSLLTWKVSIYDSAK